MNRKTCEKYAKRLALGLAAIAIAATPSFAQTYDLCATTGSVTIGTATVPIWGYIPGDCTSGSGSATLPGPELRATAGETLTINLYTDLTVPVSFFAPGLRADAATGAAGLFTAEATNTASASYTFNAKAGTYLYHSGTDITTQVPMGLYGALVVDVAAGQAYGDVFYAEDKVLVYSEIDPNLNNGIYTGGARVINWFPQYFLINGAAYPDTGSIGVGTRQDTLLRFVNAGLQTFVPTLDGGLYMDLVAEDGNRYPQPFRQYGIELPAGKTIDAIVTPGTDGTYALYDRALHLSNGGLLTKIVAGPAAGAPTALDDPATAGAYTLAEGGSLTADGVSPNPVGVLANDTTDPAGGTLTASLVAGTANGTLALADDGTFTYTPDAYFNGTDTFTYLANDGSLDSNVATATITVTPVDSSPVAVDDAYDAEVGMTLTVPALGVLANDVDVDGALMTATAVGTPSGLILNADGSFEYTPAGAAGTVESFQYEACYPSTMCSTATVTITVTAANVAPIADDDAYGTDENVALNVGAPGVLGNDTDPNLDPLTAVQVTGPTNGSLTFNANGSFTYTPVANYYGSDSFTYKANDGVLDSNVATVTITVNLVNDPPFAANDFDSTTRNSGGVTFSVTANDADATGGIAVATVDLNPLVAGRQISVTASRGGTATVDDLGNVTFVPKRGFRGTDTFTYTVQDTLGAVSNVATVRVNVN